ncbi:MAG: hypothetical protein KKA73_29750 [Chloroflexi bacterium]|nr:hypothetical protein [Chloroflexota bacterium]MBU1751883.1 hypothetical protein [Chloroflexota bacterium]MBU1878630.1 hypothetical protein [Chloroflexota bacterium]
MKPQIATVLIIIVALLLVGGAPLAQTSGAGPYTVQSGTAGGGEYHLTSLAWRVGGTVGGGGYRLVASDRAAGGNQCCCTYLPIVLRNFK